jgi:hypothetical protein
MHFFQQGRINPYLPEKLASLRTELLKTRDAVRFLVVSRVGKCSRNDGNQAASLVFSNHEIVQNNAEPKCADSLKGDKMLVITIGTGNRRSGDVMHRYSRWCIRPFRL